LYRACNAVTDLKLRDVHGVGIKRAVQTEEISTDPALKQQLKNNILSACTLNVGYLLLPRGDGRRKRGKNERRQQQSGGKEHLG
jgi:hypothetical protein